MKKQLSILTSALVLSSSAVLADSNSLEKAFENSNVSGDISVHNQTWNNDSSNDAGFTAGSIGLNYETDTFNGFKVEAGFRANHEFSEKEDGDYEAEFENDAIMNIANISYSTDNFSVKIGRQEIDLEWLGDYNEAIVASTSIIPNTALVAGYTNRIAAIAQDESKNFEDIGNDGAYVIDAKFEGIKNTVLNPYYYSAEDIASFYGLKADYDSDIVGLTAHYAASNEDVSTEEDGNILHLEARTNLNGLDLALGYIKTDKDGAIGSLDTLGDNIDPTEELGVYGNDEKTIYTTASYTISDVELSALYAQVDRANSNKDKEITLGAAYSFNKSISADVMYTDISKDSDDDQSKLAMNLVYSF